MRRLRLAPATGSWKSAVNGALIALGALAVVDNTVVHWLLGWHRLIDSWSHSANVTGEAALVLLGLSMVAVGFVRKRRRT